MNLILIVRAEMICLIILLFITLYSRFYSMGKDQGSFLRICIFAIGHVVFDLITVLTVNSADTVPAMFNRVCHIIFYMFALLFSYEFFCYSVSVCYSKNTLNKVRKLGLIPLFLYLLAVPFLPMEYLNGNGTKYSFGVAAFIGYGVAMALFLASIFVVVRNCRKLDRYMAGALLPMLGAAIVVELIQIVVPEMLFTGGTITILTVGFFFSLENPVVVLRQKVLTDAMTGVKSRHSYESEIVLMEREFSAGTQYGMVFCDINDLKTVNDTRGHLVGDEYIGCVAQILMKHLKSAEAIYRMGGDEFLAVYRSKRTDLIQNEITAVENACEAESLKRPYPVSIAIGCTVSSDNDKSLKDVLRTADYQMYTRKTKIKQRKDYVFDDAGQINIAGLTDRIFDAFSITDSNRFLFVTNMATNVTRWSVPAVEYFGMTGEFVFQFGKVLMERIHPEDRENFRNELGAVFSGKQEAFEQEFRACNGSGNYVACSVTGTVLRGKNNDPDLFAGTLLVQDTETGIDRLTGLCNGNEMMH